MQEQDPGVDVSQFNDVDATGAASVCSWALEIFDSLEAIQALKHLAIARTGIAAGETALDVGCGMGLETVWT